MAKTKPRGKFAIPPTKNTPGKYPLNTRGRAADAKGRATQQVAKGNLSPAKASKIKHEADAVLGKNDSAYHNTGCKNC